MLIDLFLFPLEFVMDNVVGTAHILDYARKLDNLKGLLISAQMRFLDQHQKELTTRKMIDIIQPILIIKSRSRGIGSCL